MKKKKQWRKRPEDNLYPLDNVVMATEMTGVQPAIPSALIDNEPGVMPEPGQQPPGAP